MSHVMVVGCGNIGSHLIPHLARLPGIHKVTLVDGQSYERKNIASQDINAADIGKPKSRVQAERLRRIRPDLTVEAVVDLVENLPHGSLWCDLIMSGLDTRLARMRLGQAVWRLGKVPWIDAGVEPEGRLARINAYLPGEDRPCYECAWSDPDYLALETVYPCDAGGGSPKPTNAPSGLGALAAGLQIIAAQNCIEGHWDLVPFGRQVLIDGMHHKCYQTSYRRNPRCRFDHGIWEIEKLECGPEGISLQEALGRIGTGQQRNESWLRVEGKPFVKRRACTKCGHAKHGLRLRESLSRKAKQCPICGGPMLASGWDLTEKLTAHLPRRVLSQSLASLGLRHGEVFTIGSPECERHFEFTVTAGDPQNIAKNKSCGEMDLR